MELAAFIAYGLAATTFIFAGTELAEVFASFGDDFGEEFELDAAERFAAEGNVKEADGVFEGVG